MFLLAQRHDGLSTGLACAATMKGQKSQKLFKLLGYYRFLCGFKCQLKALGQNQPFWWGEKMGGCQKRIAVLIMTMKMWHDCLRI
jgi:hypothetical protein